MRIIYSKIFLLFTVATLCFIATGCAKKKPASLVKVRDLSNGALVGEISVARFSGKYNIKVKDLSSGTVYSITEEDGLSEWQETANGFSHQLFCNELPAGRYAITSIQLGDGRNPGPFKTNFRFLVEPYRATYVGTLMVDWQQMNVVMGKRYVEMFGDNFEKDNQSPCSAFNIPRTIEELKTQPPENK